MSSECVFCGIVDGTISSGIVYRDSCVTAVRDINPQAPTHIVVICNKHIASISKARASDENLVGQLILAAKEIAAKEGLSHFRLVINNGREAGQSVYHLHVHLLGGRRMAWPPG